MTKKSPQSLICTNKGMSNCHVSCGIIISKKKTFMPTAQLLRRFLYLCLARKMRIVCLCCLEIGLKCFSCKASTKVAGNPPRFFPTVPSPCLFLFFFPVRFDRAAFQRTIHIFSTLFLFLDRDNKITYVYFVEKDQR